MNEQGAILFHNEDEDVWEYVGTEKHILRQYWLKESDALRDL
jgi:hypothetical protein